MEPDHRQPIATQPARESLATRSRGGIRGQPSSGLLTRRFALIRAARPSERIQAVPGLTPNSVTLAFIRSQFHVKLRLKRTVTGSFRFTSYRSSKVRRPLRVAAAVVTIEINERERARTHPLKPPATLSSAVLLKHLQKLIRRHSYQSGCGSLSRKRVSKAEKRLARNLGTGQRATWAQLDLNSASSHCIRAVVSYVSRETTCSDIIELKAAPG